MAKSSALSAKAFALAAQIEELELIEKGQQKRCSTKRKPFDSDGAKSKLEVNIAEFAFQLNKQARKAATDNMETVKVVQANPELKHKFEGALKISNSRLKYLMLAAPPENAFTPHVWGCSTSVMRSHNRNLAGDLL